MTDNRRYVYGIRIYLKDGYKPMADLAFGDGGRTNGEITTIEWDRPDEREKYHIDCYTFIWDERAPVHKWTFQEYANGHNDSYGGDFDPKESKVEAAYNEYKKLMDDLIHGITE